MIYIQMSHHLHTDEPPATFNFSQSLKAFNAVLRKSLLVIYYYLKEKKVIPQSFISKMSLEVKRIKEKMRKNERKIKKTNGENFLKRGFKPLRGEINPAEPYNLLIC